MKFFSILLCAIFFLSSTALTYGQGKILRNAKRKMENEASKKVDKKIEDVMNPETDDANNNQDPTNTSEENQKPSDDPKNSDTPPTSTSNKNSPEVNPNKKANPIPTETETVDPPEPEFKSVANDFVEGDQVIFFDDLYYELRGEFPSKWDLISGNVENATLGETNVISFQTAGRIKPLMKTEKYLPEVFTIQFDCYFFLRGNEGYYIVFDNRLSIRINNDNGHYNTSRGYNKALTSKVGWRHVDLSFNKRALKVYLDGVRVLNIPNMKDMPTMVEFKALSQGASTGNYAMVKEVRIAEGGVPLYDRLITDGKIVTNDIHFDYNKASIKSESIKTIRGIVEMMKKNSRIKLSVEGHTDSDGSESSNQSLSEDRAAAVVTAMLREGISADRLSSKGWGESDPIDSNETKEGKARNRRVEFILVK